MIKFLILEKVSPGKFFFRILCLLSKW